MNRLREAAERARGLGLLHALAYTTALPSPLRSSVRSIVAANINYALRVDKAVARVRRVCALLALDPEPIIQSAGGNPDVLEDEYRRLASGYTP